MEKYNPPATTLLNKFVFSHMKKISPISAWMEAIHSIKNSYRASMLEKERHRTFKTLSLERPNSNLVGQKRLEKESIP